MTEAEPLEPPPSRCTSLDKRAAELRAHEDQKRQERAFAFEPFVHPIIPVEAAA